jgi:hypothetical protein
MKPNTIARIPSMIRIESKRTPPIDDQASFTLVQNNDSMVSRT